MSIRVTKQGEEKQTCTKHNNIHVSQTTKSTVDDRRGKERNMMCVMYDQSFPACTVHGWVENDHENTTQAEHGENHWANLTLRELEVLLENDTSQSSTPFAKDRQSIIVKG